MLEHINLYPEFDDNYGDKGHKNRAKSNLEIRSLAKPINIFLQEQRKLTGPALKPRGYQIELYKKALEGNKIIYLGTGLGKTFIIVMLLKSTQVCDLIYSGKRVIFLAPTQDLVKQQAEYIHRQVPHSVKVYCGRTCNTGLHIDNWDVEVWRLELSRYEILFMTPAIYNQALSINAIKWNKIALVIFDEVHHAATTRNERTGKSSGTHYSQILKHYKHTQSQSAEKPMFIGLTASLVNDMPTSPEQIRLCVKDLEEKLEADCVTDLSAIETKPAHSIWTYSCTLDKCDPIKTLLLDYAKRYETALNTVALSGMKVLGPRNDEDKKILAYHNRLRLAASGFSIKPSSFHKVLKQLASLREKSGLYVLAYICYNLSRAMAEHSKFSSLQKSIKPVYTEFGNILFKITIAIDALINIDKESLLISYSEPKLICLLEVLKSEYNKVQNYNVQNDDQEKKETFSCIVFVKSRIEVKAICGWLHMVSTYIDGYDFIKVDYAIGLSATMASKWACITRRKSTEQSTTLENFRKGLLNVIVTTSVLEEGIDLPVCSTVIRYDNPETFRVYVQSRGRARQKSSTYVYMTPDKNIKDAQDALNKLNDFEYRVKDNLSRKDISSQSTIRSATVVTAQEENSQDFFIDVKNNLFVNSNNARTRLHMYCADLKRRCPYSDGLQFKRVMVGKNYQTTLFFPAGCPVKDNVVGRPRQTHELADSSAIIAAFTSLYEAGELDKNGIPLRMTEEHVDAELAKFNLKPQFSQLSAQLEGEVIKLSEKNSAHQYNWKLFNLTSSSLANNFPQRHYKLLRVVLKAENEASVRQETCRFFERSAFGLVLDVNTDVGNLPSKIWSHYGQFSVDYQLIDGDLPLREHRLHYAFQNYTYRLMTTFWNLPHLEKLNFSERCMFYVVPLNQSNKIDQSQIRQGFYPDSESIRVGDVVRINRPHQTRENRTQKFIVVEVISQMGPTSMIPGCNETFYQRMFTNRFDVYDEKQPVVAVRPISRDFARTSKGKTVKSTDSTRVVYYLWQCLERIHCDIYEAYQVYVLPEIIYQVYLNALAEDLERNFKDATIEYRKTSEATREAQQMQVDKRDDVIVDTKNDEPLDYNGCYEEEFSVEDDIADSESSYSESNSGSDSDSASEADEPKPSNTLLEIMARQEFQIMEKDKSHMEKWDMSQYTADDMRTLKADMFNSLHQPRPPYGDSINSLREDTITHQLNIEEILARFQQGFLGDCDFDGDGDDHLRLDNRVDKSIEPPISFDRNLRPAQLPLKTAFIEATTLRRANDSTNLEALENIGDTYLKYCATVVLFKYVGHNEGLLTTARSRLVGNKYLSHLAKQSKLGQYAIMNKFDREVLGAALGSRPSCKNKLRPKEMADMVESLIGASLIHGGEYEAILTLRWLGLGHIFREDTFSEFHRDTVTFAPLSTSPINRDDKQANEIFNAHRKELRQLESTLGFTFNDGAYLLQAITHGSRPNRCTESYERLEFLGDAILDLLITMTLYNAGFTKDPGQLTSSRSALVNNSTFAKVAIDYGFDRYLQHGNLEIYDALAKINELLKTETDMSFLGLTEFDRISKTLADVFEAVAGAIYLDSGCSLDSVYKIYYPMMKKLIDAEIENPTKNIISQLYETFPGKDRVKFEFIKANLNNGEESATCAKCTIYGIEEVFFGQGLNNRQAKIRAATSVMENLPDPEDKANLDKQWAELEAEKRSRTKPGFSGNQRGDSNRGDANRGGRGRGRGGGRGGHRPGYYQRHHTNRFRRY